MRAKPSSSSRSSKPSRSNKKSHSGNSKGLSKKGKDANKKSGPDLSVLRQPVDTSVCGLKQAVKVFETGTPEIVHLLSYDCDVVYECKVCRNLFRSIANFISHKRIYCTERYSQSQDLQRSNKQEEDCKIILGEKVPERLPTRITARKDLTSIVESLASQKPSSQMFVDIGRTSSSNGERRETTVHLEPMENTSYGVFQTVLKSENQNLMRNQVSELQNLLSKNEVVLGPDGRILKNGFSDLPQEEADTEVSDDGFVCDICDAKLANRKTLARHKRMLHETVKTNFLCPCCKHNFSSIWSVYRHLYKVHRKSTEQVRRLRTQILRKEVRVDKPVVNNMEGSKKSLSPAKKKLEQQLAHHQANKEWMDHFEEDGELQRCGGCGRKFERKAALLSHSQICQKRIAAGNKIEQNHHISNKETGLVPVVALSPLPVSKKPIPKPSTEKKIGIQVRMDYFKNSSGSPNQVVCRQRSSSRSLLGDESDIEVLSVDGKDSFFSQERETVDLKDGPVLEQFFHSSNNCKASEGLEKVHSYLNHTKSGLEEIQTYEISTCKRSTVLRSSIRKNKNLEAKCLQLRSALENSLSETKKDSDVSIFLDGNLDNTSESNTSAISSLSSQLTPLVDKGYVCEVEQSIEIKNINISRSPEKNTPRTEADSTSNGRLQMTCHTYKENIKFSPAKEALSEEVSTSVACEDLSHHKFNGDASCLNDNEVSLELKPVNLLQIEPKDSENNDLGNTISILTRNQLKAICKEDQPATNGMKNTTDSHEKLNSSEMEEKTRQIYKKRFSRFADEKKCVCNLCKKQFTSTAILYRHISTHTKWKRYECLSEGCDYRSFDKANIQRHSLLHTADKDTPNSSLIGIIDSAKWNIRFTDETKAKITKVKPTKVMMLKTKAKAGKLSNLLNKSSTSEKNKLKIKPGIKNGKVVKKPNKAVPKQLKTKSLAKQIKSNIISKQVKSHLIAKQANSNVIAKQKLLTDFSFHKVTTSENDKTLKTKQTAKKVKIKPKSGFVPRNKRRFTNTTEDELEMAPKDIKSNLNEQNGPKPYLKKQKSSFQGSKVVEPTLSHCLDKPAVKKQKQPIVTSSEQPNESACAFNEEKVPEKLLVKTQKTSALKIIDQTSENLNVLRKEDIIVNHIKEEHNETNFRGRSSRTSSRKTSLNSSDQQKGKNSISPVNKVEDKKTSQLIVCDSSNSCFIQSPAIVDGSLDEEESQEESDKPVDDSQLQEMYKVILGGYKPEDVALTSSTRPFRNKIRPRKMNDCILSNLKEKESVEDKSAGKKPKLSIDLKVLPEVPTKKCK